MEKSGFKVEDYEIQFSPSIYENYSLILELWRNYSLVILGWIDDES